MAISAKVVVLPVADGPLEVQDVQFPDPGPHQVIVKQYASGICHSQLHQMHQPRQAPVILGHESTGVVLETGAEVSHVRPGDTVLVTWVPRNIRASNRSIERASLELSDGTTAVSQNVFTWADHTIADEQFVVKVPGDIEKEVTSIIGCAVMTGAGAVEYTAKVQKGDSVAIFGAGGVGLSAVVAARVLEADPIIVVDLDDEKLAFSRRFGATHTINAAAVDPVAAIKELTTDDSRVNIASLPVSGADFVFDCIGVKSVMEQVVPAARTGYFGAEPGGTAVLVGIPTTTLEIVPIELLVNEKHLIGSIGGSCQPDRDFPKYLDWHKQGLLNLEGLVTARYTIDQINAATDDLEAGKISGRSILVF